MSFKKGPRPWGSKATINQTLQVIPKPPSSETVLIPSIVPLFVGQGKTNLLCGGCGLRLAERIYKDQVQNLVIQCPECAAYNRVPPFANPSRSS